MENPVKIFQSGTGWSKHRWASHRCLVWSELDGPWMDWFLVDSEKKWSIDLDWLISLISMCFFHYFLNGLNEILDLNWMGGRSWSLSLSYRLHPTWFLMFFMYPLVNFHITNWKDPPCYWRRPHRAIHQVGFADLEFFPQKTRTSLVGGGFNHLEMTYV
jgi:hypothetical protein